MTDSVKALIADLGGTAFVAGELPVAEGEMRVSFSTVHSWGTRGSIPADRWADLVDIAERSNKAGVTYERLARLHRKSRASAAEPQPAGVPQ